MKKVPSAISAALALLASPALAQPAAGTADPVLEAPPTEASDLIVVRGARPLWVDIEQVAQRCSACLRALARLQALADAPQRGEAPRTVEQVQGRPQNDELRSPVNISTASARDMMLYSEVMTRGNLTRESGSQPIPGGSIRAQVDRFYRNLLRYVGPIVDDQIAERSAPAAYAADDPAARGLATIDITADVVAALDRDHRDIDLLARPPRDGRR